jgi:hypothetical protein
VAAYFGTGSIIHQLLKTPAVDDNARDCFNQTPLSWAAAKGYPKVVRLFLAQRDIIIEPKAELSLSPLSLALFAGHTEIVGLLSGYNDKIHVLKTIGGSSEITVKADGDQESVQLLLYRTKVDGDPSERPLPQSATEYGINGIVWLLLNKDAYIREDHECKGVPELQLVKAQICRRSLKDESPSTQVARRGWSIVLALIFKRRCTTSIRLIHEIFNILSVIIGDESDEFAPGPKAPHRVLCSELSLLCSVLVELAQESSFDLICRQSSLSLNVFYSHGPLPEIDSDYSRATQDFLTG